MTRRATDGSTASGRRRLTAAPPFRRLATPHAHVIALLDDCYRLVGIIKSTWEGISGGAAMEAAVQCYFDDLRATAMVR